MEFEGKMFPPRQTDAVLRKIYGDYMQLPDLEYTSALQQTRILQIKEIELWNRSL